MVIKYYGNAVDITYSIGDPPVDITLLDGYSIEEMVITRNSGIYGIRYGVPIDRNVQFLRFPPVNSRNPNTITPLFDNTKENRFTFLITKFGQIPDPHYFDEAFEPILVTGDDGDKYNVIPSSQFK